MWESTVDGRQLHFHLAGINNQNFIMRDEETGTWWQQVSGEAILGPLKGHKLREVFHDEVTFALWKQEQPHGRQPQQRPMCVRHIHCLIKPSLHQGRVPDKFLIYDRKNFLTKRLGW